MSSTPATIQADHFSKVAQSYDSTIHDDEHELSLRLISAYIDRLSLTSILDVGCGTGRGVEYFLENHPSVRVHGIEPVDEMRKQAVRKGIPAELISAGVGQNLPFPAASFDAVCAFGVMHHTERPSAVLSEMCRIAKQAIFISDSNRFGQGSRLNRLTKLAAWQLGMWPSLNLVLTRGRGYHVSQTDGLFYSYSVYDNLPQLSKWARELSMIPIRQERKATNAFNPLLTASHILVCAVAGP